MTAPSALPRTVPDSMAWMERGSRAPAGESAGSFRNALGAASSRSDGDNPTERKDRLTSPALHALTMATELAVNELGSRGPVKQTVADAAQRQVAPSDREAPPETESHAGEAPARARGFQGDPRQASRVTSARSGSSDNAPQTAANPASPAGRSAAQPADPDVNHAPPPRADAPVGPGTTAAPPPGQPSAAEAAAIAPSQAAEAAPAPTRGSTEPRTNGIGPGVRTGAGPKTATTRTQAAAPKEPQADKLAAQIGRSLAAALRQKNGTVTLRLKQEDLGSVKVRVQLSAGRVEARFEVADEKARALIDRTLGQLRSALEGQGLHVDKITIHAAPAAERDTPTPPHPHSGPGFANDLPNHAGGEPGGHGRHSAESASGGIAGEPAHDAAAEQEQESPLDTARSGPGGLGGAPIPNPVWSGLDAVA